MDKDIRWIQRFDNYLKAFNELKEAIDLTQKRDLSRLERQGVIQGFEYTHELAWKVIKDYLSNKGYTDLVGSKDCTRQAFQVGLITFGEVWMEMIKSRNLTSHTYDEEIADDVYFQIVNEFYPVFLEFTDQFSRLAKKEER